MTRDARMILQKDSLNKIKDFGLNSYEAKLWTALLSRGVSTAGELSDIANVPRSRSYDVLESLEKKGFIIMKLGKPIKYIAVQPDEVVERVKKRIRDDAEEKSNIMNGLKDSNILKELSLLHSQGVEFIESSDLSGSFRGRDLMYNHLDSLIKKSQKSVDIMTTSEGMIRKAKLLKNSIKKAKDRGVKIRIAVPHNKDNSTVISNFSQFAEIRDTDKNARFCIVDDQDLLFMVLDDKEVHPSYDTGVWVNTKYFTNTVKSFFDNEWSKN